jgi:hypothetical protein
MSKTLDPTGLTEATLEATRRQYADAVHVDSRCVVCNWTDSYTGATAYPAIADADRHAFKHGHAVHSEVEYVPGK